MIFPIELMALQLERIAFYAGDGLTLEQALNQTARDLRKWNTANQGMTIQSATKDWANHIYT